MKHYGDITKLSGYELPVVDVITGGSPCQDLSVAGKRAGLAGERSGLFMEQMRIVKEMREHDRLSGRTGFLVRPRYMVWENVPGAFSSGNPKGADFAAVIEEIIKVAELGAAVCVRVPDGGWTKSGCYYADDGSWSIAWRVHDAQFWGVPQRRKRIALVADFGGLSASEILFERKGLRRDTEPGKTAGKGTAGGTEEGTGGASGFTNRGCYSGDVTETLRSDPHGAYPCVGIDVYNHQITGEVAASVTAATGGTNHSGPKVLCLQGNGIDRADPAGCNGRGWCEDVSYTLNTIDRPAVYPRVANTLSARYDGSPQPDKGNGANIVCAGFKSGQGSAARGIGYQEEVAPTLPSGAGGNNQPLVVEPLEQRAAMCPGGEIVPALVASAYKGPGNTQDGMAVLVFDKEMYNAGEKMTGEMQARYDNVAPTVRADSHHSGICTSVVRRLTPMECERLQGYPDGWTDIGDWTDSKGKKRKTTDGPRYKALGNSIALPFWQFLARRICAQYERDVTLGSLFDGIGGFPYVFERCGAKAVWASEIEEFAIAVTKKRFPEEDEG